jgi:hypothetical protein
MLRLQKIKKPNKWLSVISRPTVTIGNTRVYFVSGRRNGRPSPQEALACMQDRRGSETIETIKEQSLIRPKV